MEANQNQNNLIGFLFDVSGSMKSSFKQLQNKYLRNNHLNDQTRFQTIFDVLQKFIDIEEIQNNNFFSLAFGTKNDGEIADMMKLIQNYVDIKKQLQQVDNRDRLYEQNYQDNINFVYIWFLFNGACNLHKFYTIDDAKNDLNFEETVKIKIIIKYNPQFLQEFITTLPKAVLKRQNDTITNLLNITGFYSLRDMAAKNIFTNYTSSEIKQQVQKFKEKINVNDIQIFKNLSKNISYPDINKLCTLQVREFREIIQESRSIFKQETQDILEDIAYQGTPLKETLNIALNHIQSRDNKKLKDNKRIIFIVSDGDSTDGDPSCFAEQLKNMNVIIVSCFITDKIEIAPNQLYSSKQQQWSLGAKKMFDLSSEMDYNQQPLRYLARNCSYKLSHTGKNRLFIQANNPGTIQKFIDSVSKAIYDIDVLLDIIGNVDLEPYISFYEQFPAPNQKGGTCYANAIAAAYYMSMKRIYKRDGGYPLYSEEQEIQSQLEYLQNNSSQQTKSFLNFDFIRKCLIEEFGVQGANSQNVIKNTCSKYRLRYSEVNINEAKEALNKGQPLVARFSLCESQWNEFSKFYQLTPQGVAEYFGPNPDGQEEQGHAVILIGYGQDHLKFLNSWGAKWGNQGTFKVKNENVLNKIKFFHIYWYLSDLLPIEIQNFKENSNKIFINHTKKFKDIYENVEYTCPVCQIKSPIKSYSGSICEAICPRCNISFQPKSLGSTFVNYIYGKDI